jgi:magnesium chelatase family protein
VYTHALVDIMATHSSLHLCARCGHQISKKNLKPLLDRIDIHIEVPRVDYEKLSCNKVSESSESIRQRVQAARNIQQTRFTNTQSNTIVSNADMRIGEIRQFCQFQLSACAYHRILKLSCTIADLAGSEEIQSAHLGEALQYRPKIMMGLVLR